MVAHYQTELTNLDQEIIAFQAVSDTLKNHAQFNKKWQEVKDYITKINKEIIFKKQNKLTKDRIAFTEGYAYRWQTPFQSRGPRKMNLKRKQSGNEIDTTDEDTETDSDSSLSIFSS